MMTSSTAESSARSRRAQCVLLVSRGAGGGGENVARLIEALERRDVVVRRCDGKYPAMAEIAVLTRHRREGSMRDPIVVVITQPGSEAAELHVAASRYAPQAVFWMLEAGASPRLVHYQPPESPESVPASIDQVDHASGKREPGAVSLRLAGTDEPEEPALEHASASTPAPRDPPSVPVRSTDLFLSDEELSMLLGEGPNTDDR